MTTCDKCKSRIQCKTKTSNYKHYCQYCGCLEDACHCNKPDIIKSKVNKITLSKSADCRTCNYRVRCMKLQGASKHKIKGEVKIERFCGYCGCLTDVCHCSLPTGIHEKDNRKYEVKKG